MPRFIASVRTTKLKRWEIVTNTVHLNFLFAQYHNLTPLSISPQASLRLLPSAVLELGLATLEGRKISKISKLRNGMLRSEHRCLTGAGGPWTPKEPVKIAKVKYPYPFALLLQEFWGPPVAHKSLRAPGLEVRYTSWYLKNIFFGVACKKYSEPLTYLLRSMKIL